MLKDTNFLALVHTQKKLFCYLAYLLRNSLFATLASSLKLTSILARCSVEIQEISTHERLLLLRKSTIVAKQFIQHLMHKCCVSSRKLPCWIAYLWLCWSSHTFTHRHVSIYGLWSHTFQLCMNILIQPVFFLAVFFDNSYKIAFNATPYISSHKKLCNFLMVCWLISSHQFWQFKPT